MDNGLNLDFIEQAPMGFLFKHFWVALIVFNVANGLIMWNRAQDTIKANPELQTGYRKLFWAFMVLGALPFVLMGAGIASGQVGSFVHFLFPGQGNWYVSSWYGALGIGLLIGSIWMFALDGAEMLERHPGLFPLPRWSANKLKLLWIGGVIWNVGIISILWSGLLWGSKNTSLHSGSLGLWSLFPIGFVAFWLFISWVISIMGGWSSLAQKYPLYEKFQGRQTVTSGRVGMCNYGGALKIGANDEGLYLGVFFLFRFGHKPLMVPWESIKVERKKKWFSRRLLFRIGENDEHLVEVREKSITSMFKNHPYPKPLEFLKEDI